MDVVDNGDEAREDLVHRFNAQLPYKDSLPKERDLLLADIVGALTYAAGMQDNTVQVLRACFGLERVRALKYNVDDSSRLFIAQALYDLAFPRTGLPLPWQCGDKVMHALTTLISKKQGQLALVGKLVLPWRTMFATLDECVPRGFPLASGSTERSRLSALVDLIRHARRYWAPGADREIWDEFKGEIGRTQTQGAFKALYLLCLFMPTRSSLYGELLPEWFRLWGQVDHCPSWDGAWLTLVCRASQHPPPSFDWTPYMADIYNLTRATIRTLVSMGDAGSAPLPRGRQVAYQYQSIAPSACRTGIIKLNKLAVMVVFFLGKGGPAELVRMSDVAIVPPAGEGIDSAYGGGGGDKQHLISPGAKELMSLFRGLRTYFHPSNGGRWTTDLAFLTNFVLSGVAERVGCETVLREAGRLPPTGELMHGDAQLIVDALLPLVLEMVYSKDLSMGSIANNCLSVLAALSPKTVAPASMEVIFRALDPVASINHTHQAPAAIRALTCLFHPLMYPRPYLAPYLPALLELTLPGLDANDVIKTTVTLHLYHTILCWVPVRGNAVSYSTGALDNWKPAPATWLDAREQDEAEDVNEHEHLYTACENLGGVLLEWSAAFLDRLFEVLRHKDKPSKVKAGDLAADTMNVAAAMTGLGGAGSGMLAATLGGNWREALLTFLIKLVTQQLFTMGDEPAAEMAATKVLRFVTDRALPHVEKDAAGVVEALASARPEKTVSAFFPALCDGLLAASAPLSEAPTFAPSTSPALLRWRLQLLSGLVRGGGAALAPHGPTLRRLVAAGISHDDKSVRKGARKVLRKALQGLCETYSADSRSLPPVRWANLSSAAEWRRLCEPVAAENVDITWVQPSTESLALAASLLDDFLVQPLTELTLELAREPAKEDATVGSASRAGVWREHLKTMEYAFRGAVCVLGDRGTPGEDDEASGQHLRDDVFLAVGSRGLSHLLAAKDGHRLYGIVAGLRAETARFMRSALDACAQENGPVDVKSAKLVVRLSERVACTRGGKGQKSRAGFASMLRVGMQRDEVALAMRKMRLSLVNEAAANGDPAAVADQRRAFSMGGPGRGRGWPRAAVVLRTSLLHRQRLEIAPRTLAIAARDAANTADKTKQEDGGGVSWPGASAVLDRQRALFDGLVQLSSSEYAMVRAAAQVGVNRMGSVCPWFVREAVPALIDRLSQSGPEQVEDESDGASGDSAHRRLTGACYLLHQRRSMRHVASKWSHSRALLLALCDSQSVLARLPTDKQEKAAARVAILFTSYVSCWRANTLATDEDKAEHDALLDGLLERLASLSTAASSAGGGWRYQLMASWCLMHLIRPPGSSKRLDPRSSSEISTSPAALPMTVWRWFAECLSGGDGQPLQRLALGALTRLLSSADPVSPGGGEVSVLLSSKAFLQPFFLALAYNHRKQATEGGLAGTEQWSLGVKEIIQDVGRGDTRELFPRLRFEARSGLFWARNARLVSTVVSAVREESRGECIRVLLEEATAAKAGAAHEDKRSFDCAAAEVGAGVVAVLVGEQSWSEGQEVLRETALPFIETALEGVSLEGSLDWSDVLRFALDHSTPEGSGPLVSMVVDRTMLELRDGGKGRDNYSVLVKWLSFVGAVFAELMGRQVSASRAESIAKQIFPLLVEGLDHPFKACREEIARNLFLVTHATDVAWAKAMADGVRESVLAEAAALEEEPGRISGDGEADVASGIATLSVTDATDAGEDVESALLASAMAMSDGAPTEEEEAAVTRAKKRLSLRRETVLQWLHSITAAGDHARYLPIFAALLPVALQSVRDSNVDVSTLGRGVCLSCAVALAARSPKGSNLSSDNKDADSAAPDAMDVIVNATLSAASTPSSWRVRRNAAAVACILQTRLHFVLTPAQHRACDAGLLSLLGDSRREVQETARLAMSTRVAHLTPAHIRVMCEQFAEGADNAAASRKKRRRLAKRQAAVVAAKGAGTGAGSVAVSTGEPAGALGQQQTNVLGLSAVVLASPCDVPPWVPAALESLAKHANDESPGRLPVRQTVTHTFKEFRRTHQDKWEESHKARFSRDQLDVFDDVLGGAHSYFI